MSPIKYFLTFSYGEVILSPLIKFNSNNWEILNDIETSNMIQFKWNSKIQRTSHKIFFHHILRKSFYYHSILFVVSKYFIGVQKKRNWIFKQDSKDLIFPENHSNYLIINIPKFGNFWDVTLGENEINDM